MDRKTWDEIESAYYSYLRSIPYDVSNGAPLPFPGRILTKGDSGDDVLALQQYLNLISDYYPQIPKVSEDGILGPSTLNAINQFISVFGLPYDGMRVTAPLWYAITNVYDDLNAGGVAREGQFPGYNLQ